MSGPIIRLEIEQMRHTILHHLSQHNSRMEAAIAEQLRQVVQDFDYGKAVEKAAREAIDRVVRDAVSDFFVLGDGRKVIGEAVKAHLSQMQSFRGDE